MPHKVFSARLALFWRDRGTLGGDLGGGGTAGKGPNKTAGAGLKMTNMQPKGREHEKCAHSVVDILLTN